MKILWSIIISLLLIIYPANNADAAESLSTTADTSTRYEKPGCEYAVPLNINETDYVGQTLKNPDSIASNEEGVLNTTIEVKYADNKIGDCDVHLRSYNGNLVGPTLKAHPGDTIKINLINELPLEEDLDPNHDINVPHDFNTTNFHTHGLHVDPNGMSDNVLKKMPPRKQEGDSPLAYQIEVEIPEDHPSGTFWYHPHLHGSTALQVSSGMAGALIIEGGGLDLVPEIAAANKHEKIFMFQQIAYDNQGRIENYRNFGAEGWANLGRHTTINGQIKPKIEMRPGEIQRWRFIHGGIRESLYLELRDNNHRQVPLHEIALDGIPLGKLDSWKDKPIELEPGYRSDVLFQAPTFEGKQRAKIFYLIDKPTPKKDSVSGAGEPGHILATVVVKGEPMEMNLPNDLDLAEVGKKDAPKDIKDSEITNFDNPQIVIFGAKKDENGSFKFTISNSEDKKGEPFDPKIERKLKLNTSEIWKLESIKPEWEDQDDQKANVPTVHPFHIHVNPFQYERKGPDGNPETIWRDTLLVTEGSPQEIRTRYDEFTGKSVFHCHILDHEDKGMMELMEITDQSVKQ